VANAAHIKNVPGRKTDVNDAMWIADLVACGLIKASFIPDQEIQELRSLLRACKQLTREKSSHTLRIQKTLRERLSLTINVRSEEANIKLDSVISDRYSRCKRTADDRGDDRRPAQSVQARRTGRPADQAQPKALYDALHGRQTDHHRFMLQLYLEQYDALAAAIAKIDQEVDAAIARMDEEVDAGQATFRSLITLLCTMPGIGTLAATTILAEIGRDMSRFPAA
jgi:transposase